MLPTPEIHRSNPIISNFYSKDENKEKASVKGPILTEYFPYKIWNKFEGDDFASEDRLLSGMSCGVRQRRESPASHRAGTLAEELGRQLCPASRLPEMRGHLQLLSTKQSIPGKSFLTKKWYSNTSTT